VLDIMVEERLPERAGVIGDKVMAAFRSLADRHAIVGDVRGLGAMCALEIVDPASGAGDAARAGKVVAAAREGGLLVMTASGHVIRTLMPLTISDDELDRGLGILAAAVAQVA
jgi:4-aminobutyrate aminotransferase/(S)-3-amino-2-methylpropionate transaminase